MTGIKETRKRILIADDDKDIIETLSESFDPKLYKVVTSFDGQEALFKFKNEEFDAVVTDIRMPKMDGIELVKAIRKTKNIPVFVISASVDDYSIELETMVNVVNVTKPFSPLELSQRVCSILKTPNKDGVENEVKYKAGEAVFQEQSVPTEIYFVKEGKFSVYKRTKNGMEVEVAVVTAGEVLGEMSPLVGEKRSASVRAVTDGVLIRLPVEKVHEVLNTQPKWFKVLVKTISTRLSDTTQQLAEIKAELKSKN